MRKDKLVNGEIYHIFNKSIAEFRIFNSNSDYSRIMGVLRYYRKEKPPMKFSDFIKIYKGKKNYPYIYASFKGRELVVIIAYCIMPTHLHLVLKQSSANGISIFMNNVLNSYTRYFNTKHKRKGPLWEGRFRNVLVETTEQLLHLTRYVHLNPVTSYLVDKPEDWTASSYREYLLKINENDKICEYNDILDIKPDLYSEFVRDRISYQRELADIKHLCLE